MIIRYSKSIWQVGIIGVNLILALSAFLYDFSALTQVPAWARPFIIICPLWPAVLALWQTWPYLFTRPSPHLLTALALIPPATYGILSFMLYPYLLNIEGFSWLVFLSPAWVWLYAIQAWFIIVSIKPRLPAWATFCTAGWLIASLGIQYATNSFDYLALAELAPWQRLSLLLVGTSTSLGLATYLSRQSGSRGLRSDPDTL